MESLSLDPLSRIAIQHGTDKFGGHQYTPHYHKLFAHLRERPLRLLEIGVGGYDVPLSGGQSLRMWVDYFPNARIVGLDIAEKRMPLPPRVTLVQGSQTDTDFLDHVCAEHGPFDIIIDDGSHQVEHVLTSFHHLYPRMPEDGIYVVEDTQTAFWPGAGGHPEGQGSIFDVAHQVALAMHEREVMPPRAAAAWKPYGEITVAVQVLRNMIVFERGSNRYPSNAALSMEDPEVEAMTAVLLAETTRNPSPGSYLTRIDLANCAGRFDLSLQALREALEIYPFHTDILLSGIRFLDHAQMRDDALMLVKRLAALFPSDPAIAAMLAGREGAD